MRTCFSYSVISTFYRNVDLNIAEVGTTYSHMHESIAINIGAMWMSFYFVGRGEDILLPLAVCLRERVLRDFFLATFSLEVCSLRSKVGKGR